MTDDHRTGSERLTPPSGMSLYLTEDRLRFLQSIVDQSIDGIAVADLNGKVLFVNEAFAGVHGYTPAEVTGKNLSIFHAPEQLPGVVEANVRLLSDGVLEQDVGHVHKDGTRFLARMRNTLLRDDQDQPIGFIGTLRLVSEQDQIKELLWAQQDLAAVLSATSGLDETLQLCLETALQISGMEGGGIYLVDEATGGVDIVHHVALPAEFVQAARHFDADTENVRALRRGRPIYTSHEGLDHRYGAAPRREQFSLIAIIPVFYENSLVGSLNLASTSLEQLSRPVRAALETIAGRLGGAIVRARMATKLQESEARFRALFDNSINPIGLMRILFDDHGQPHDFIAQELNPVMRRQMAEVNLDAEEAVQKPLSRLMSPQSVAVVRKVCATLLLTGKPVTFDRYSDLWKRHFIVSAFCPTPTQIALVFTDITDLKAVEAELRRHQELLEERVAERTNELERANNELLLLNDELERSNAELEQFASVASHDLQAPLRHIAGFLDLLQKRLGDTLDDPVAQDYLTRSLDGAARLRQMIADLLALSRVDSHALPPEQVALDALLDEVLADLNLDHLPGGLDLTRDELPVVQGVRSQLRRVLQNLLHNALKFRGDDPPHVRIGAKARDELWQISVSDQGIGIPAKDRTRVFRIFTRLHTRDEYPGTGIGLAICKKIVARHHGRIWIESAEGEGTTVHFTLPRTDSVG